MEYVYKQTNKKLLLTRGATLVVYKEGTVRRIENGVLKESIELSIGTKIFVDSFNFYTNTVISHVNDIQISIPYEFLSDNCLLEENQKNVVMSGICLLHTTMHTCNLQDLMYIVGVAGAFLFGLFCQHLKF